MRARQTFELHSLTVIQAFITANEPRFARIAASTTRTQFDNAINDARRFADAQRHTAIDARGLTAEINVLRTELVEYIAIIREIGRLKLGRDHRLVRMKVPRIGTNHHVLADIVRAIVHHARRAAEGTLDGCLPADFIERLENVCRSMIKRVDNRRLCQSRAKEATNGLHVSLGIARRAAGALDVLITTTSRNDPALMAAWVEVISVGKKGNRLHTNIQR